MKNVLMVILFTVIGYNAFSQCTDCPNPKIIRVTEATIEGVDFSTLTTQQCLDILACADMSSLSAIQCADILACIDFTLLSNQQIIDMTQRVDFSLLTTQQETDFCAVVATCGAAAIDWADALSTDSPNGLVLGSDNLLYVPDEVVEFTTDPTGNAVGTNEQFAINTSNGQTFYNDGGVWAITGAAVGNPSAVTQVVTAGETGGLARQTIATHSDGTGAPSVAIQETVTTLVDNGDGSFTHTSEDDESVTFDANKDEIIYYGSDPTGIAVPTDKRLAVNTADNSLYVDDGGVWAAVPAGGGAGTNYFTADQVQTGNRTHDAQGLNITVEDINILKEEVDNFNYTYLSDGYYTAEVGDGAFQEANVELWTNYAALNWTDNTNITTQAFLNNSVAALAYDSAIEDSNIKADNQGVILEASDNTKFNQLELNNDGYMRLYNNSPAAPVGTPSQGVWLYTVGNELFVRDGSGNTTQLSNHNSLGILDEFVDPLDEVAQFGRTWNDDKMNISYSFLDINLVAIVNICDGSYKVYNEDRAVVKAGNVKL